MSDSERPPASQPEDVSGCPRQQIEESRPADLTPLPTASIQIVKKHPLAIRWMHWINFPVLFTMIWSGLMIYWADSVPPGGDHISNVYRIGFGHWTLVRLFPQSFYQKLGLDAQLPNGLGWHFLFMWFFVINGIAYVLYL